MRVIMAVALLGASASAHAYIGPGLGLGVIGALVGGILALTLALFGLVWYPLKRLTAKVRTPGSVRLEEPKASQKSAGDDRDVSPTNERHDMPLAEGERWHE